jgi:RNA polymerase sigma-70 factor (ECF subfamily)
VRRADTGVPSLSGTVPVDVVTATEMAIIGVPAPACSPSRQLDPEALGEHIDRLYRAARALCGSREESEDLVQETLARVLRKPRMLRSGDDLGYLLRVLRNTFLSARRAASRRPEEIVPPDTFERLEDVSGVQPEARIEAAQLYALISTLSPDFRDAVVAVDVIGLSYHEAARALRVREATIATRLHRGRQRVARGLSEPIAAFSGPPQQRPHEQGDQPWLP